MPPKKKGGNGRKTNKKKGNRGASTSSSAGSATATPMPVPRFPPINSANNGPALKGTLPNMKGFERRNPINPDDYPTVYQRYKDATKRFIAYMEKQARAFGILSENNKIFVKHLTIVADHMDNEGCTVDALALTDLKLTIRIRT